MLKEDEKPKAEESESLEDEVQIVAEVLPQSIKQPEPKFEESESPEEVEIVAETRPQSIKEPDPEFVTPEQR